MAHIDKDAEYFTNDSSELSHTNVINQKNHTSLCVIFGGNV